MEKICTYYNLHIKDKKSKEVLTNAKGTSDQSKYCIITLFLFIFYFNSQPFLLDSLDCIHALLLNAVILPTARFSDKTGKNSKKTSIADAIEGFIVHLISINDYEKVISELREKYYKSASTSFSN